MLSIVGNARCLKFILVLKDKDKDKILALYDIIAFMDYRVRGVRKLLNRFKIIDPATKLHKTS